MAREQVSALHLGVMPLNHKDPLRELLDLQERMNRLFDETLTRERRPAVTGAPVFHRLERHCGPFARGFRFAEEVDPDRIKAEFSDGLLRLEVPKVRARSTTRIRVERTD